MVILKFVYFDTILFLVGVSLASSLFIPGALRYFELWKKTRKGIHLSLWTSCFSLAFLILLGLYCRFLAYFFHFPLFSH